jgi:hypothetical protein
LLSHNHQILYSKDVESTLPTINNVANHRMLNDQICLPALKSGRPIARQNRSRPEALFPEAIFLQ